MEGTYYLVTPDGTLRRRTDFVRAMQWFELNTRATCLIDPIGAVVARRT